MSSLRNRGTVDACLTHVCIRNAYRLSRRPTVLLTTSTWPLRASGCTNCSRVHTGHKSQLCCLCGRGSLSVVMFVYSKTAWAIVCECHPRTGHMLRLVHTAVSKRERGDLRQTPTAQRTAMGLMTKQLHNTSIKLELAPITTFIRDHGSFIEVLRGERTASA